MPQFCSGKSLYFRFLCLKQVGRQTQPNTEMFWRASEPPSVRPSVPPSLSLHFSRKKLKILFSLSFCVYKRTPIVVFRPLAHHLTSQRRATEVEVYTSRRPPRCFDRFNTFLWPSSSAPQAWGRLGGFSTSPSCRSSPSAPPVQSHASKFICKNCFL